MVARAVLVVAVAFGCRVGDVILGRATDELGVE